MATSTHTRRRIIAAMGALPVIALGEAPALADLGADAAILQAWEIRQRALAEIEARGTFFDSENVCPELAGIFDSAEMRIIRTEATTARGALAQAWVALSHCGDGFTEKAAARCDLVRRADFAALEPLAVPDMDCDEEAIFQVIRTLRTLCGEG